MSEKEFQKALLHLYMNLDQLGSYPEDVFEKFSLSPSQEQSMRELIASDWEGLVVFNRQLEGKRRRVIHHALPRSLALFGRELEILLTDFASASSEGARPSTEALRTFGGFLGAKIDARGAATDALEFIRFEAVYAELSLRPVSLQAAPPPAQVSHTLRLPRDGDTALIHCPYDVSAAMKASSAPADHSDSRKPCWLFLFRTRDGVVRVLNVSTALASVLKRLADGASFGDTLRTLERATERTALSESAEGLLRIGVPFVDAPEDRTGALADRLTNG